MSYAPNTFPSSETRHYQHEMDRIQDVDDVARAFGSMRVDPRENQTIYFGGAHWISILSEVCH